MKTFEEKLKYLAALLEKQTIEELNRKKLGCEANIFNAKTTIKPGRKYTKIDIGRSGRYMVENDTGKIYGIKAYGVIHRGHYYGTLDTVDDYFWGTYTAYKRPAENPPAVVAESYQRKQCLRCEQDHDPAFFYKIKLSGTANSTNYMDITNGQYQAIKKIICGGE